MVITKLKILVIKYSCKVNFIGKQVDKNASSITHVIFDIDMECTGVQCVNSICIRMCMCACVHASIVNVVSKLTFQSVDC